MKDTMQQIADLFRGKMASFDEYKTAASAAFTLASISAGPERSLVYRLRHSSFQPGYDYPTPSEVVCDNKSVFYYDQVTATNWWWQREAVRQYTGVYPYPTDAMLRVIQDLHLAPFAVHMSRDPETPEAICYTPDNAMGQADRQVKLSSLSKLITKLFPLATEEYKQYMEAAHRAELDATILFARTREEIQRVYQNMDGDSGCMRYDHTQWGLPAGYHPSNVYEAPGVAVAYHEVGGVIKARALTWENPLTGDKQYVRLYGDRALKRKLERAGYRFGSMAGARIKAIQMPKERYDEDMYLVPYIDGGLGNQNHDGVYGYIDQRTPEYIQLISGAQARQLQNAGISVNSFRDHRNVVHNLAPQDLSSLYFTCPLTGVDVDKARDRTLSVWLNGKVQSVLRTPDAERRFSRALKRMVMGRWVQCQHTDNTPYFYDRGYGAVADTHEHRIELDYRRLSTKFYASDEWVGPYSHKVTATGDAIKVEDAAKLIHADETTEYIHRSQVKSIVTRKSPYFSVGEIDGMLHYAHQDNPKVRVLRSGKRAVIGYHEIYELFDGTWTHKRNLEARRFYGEPVRWIKGEALPVSPDMAERALRNVLQSAFDVKAFCEMALLRCSMDASQATGFVRNYLFQRLTDGRLNHAAGHVPGFYNDGSFYGMTSSNWFNSVDLARVYLGQCERIDTSELGSVAVGHLALLIAVLREVTSLYDNLETLVNHAHRRMTETHQLAEAA